MEKIKSFFKSLLKKEWVQTTITSILCALVGLFIGFLVLLIIKPSAAFEGIIVLLKGPFNASSSDKLYRLGLVFSKSAPLILCGIAILFAYKAGLFNIGCAGQYTIGVCACLYSALVLNLNWFLCLILSILAGALYGLIVGVLKAYFNINEVISGIMLNWISLYFTNNILKDERILDRNLGSQNYLLSDKNPTALLPNLGLDKLFSNNKYVTIAILIAIVIAIVINVIINRTTFGYELKATGNNRHAAKYCGMKEKANIMYTLAISGALAGLSAACFYLTDKEPWYYGSSVPSMGFDGISAAFLGGLSPIGTIISSFFIKYIEAGGSNLDTRYYSSDIGSMITSLIIYLCAFVSFIKIIINKKINSKDESKGGNQ